MNATSPSSFTDLLSPSSGKFVLSRTAPPPKPGWANLGAKADPSSVPFPSEFPEAQIDRITDSVIDVACPMFVNHSGQAQRSVITSRYFHVVLDLFWVATGSTLNDATNSDFYMAGACPCARNLQIFLVLPEEWSRAEHIRFDGPDAALKFVVMSPPDLTQPLSQPQSTVDVSISVMYHFGLRSAGSARPSSAEPVWTITPSNNSNVYVMLKNGVDILHAQRVADGEKAKAAEASRRHAEEEAERRRREVASKAEIEHLRAENERLQRRSPSLEQQHPFPQQSQNTANDALVAALLREVRDMSLSHHQLAHESNKLHIVTQLTHRRGGSTEREVVLAATQGKGVSLAKGVFGLPGIAELLKAVEESASFGIAETRKDSDWALDFVLTRLIPAANDEDRKRIDTAPVPKGLAQPFGVTPAKGRQIDHLAVALASVRRVRDRHAGGVNIAAELEDIEAFLTEVLKANIDTVMASSHAPSAKAPTPLIVKDKCATANTSNAPYAESALTSRIVLSGLVGVKHTHLSLASLVNVHTDVEKKAELVMKSLRLDGPYVTMMVGAARKPDNHNDISPGGQSTASLALKAVEDNYDLYMRKYFLSALPALSFVPAPIYSALTLAESGGAELTAQHSPLPSLSMAASSMAPAAQYGQQQPLSRPSPPPHPSASAKPASSTRFSQPGSFGFGVAAGNAPASSKSKLVGLPVGTNARFASRNCAVGAATTVACSVAAAALARKVKFAGLARAFAYARDFDEQSALLARVLRALKFQKGARPAGNTAVGEFFEGGANDAVSIVAALGRKVAFSADSAYRLGDLFSVSQTRDNSKPLLAMLLFAAANDASAPGHWTAAVCKTTRRGNAKHDEWTLLDVGTATPLGPRVKGFADRKVFYVHGEHALGSTQAGKSPLLGYGPAIGVAAPLPPRRTVEDKRAALVATIAGRNPLLLENERPAAPARRRRRRAGKGSGAKKHGPASEKLVLAASTPLTPPQQQQQQQKQQQQQQQASPPAALVPASPQPQLPVQEPARPLVVNLCDSKKSKPEHTFNHADAGDPHTLRGDELYPIEQSSVFRRGRIPQPQDAALFPAGYLLSLRFHQHTTDGYVEATSAQKISLLRRFQEFLELHPAVQNLSIVDATLYFLDFCTKRSAWQPQTLFRSMNTLSAALKNLACYCDQNLSIDLFSDPRWRGHFREIKQVQSRSQPRNQTYALWPQVHAAVQICQGQDPSSALTLLLMWFTCARPGCVMKLRRRDIEFSSATHFSITFADGKGSRFGQIYTVPSVMPPDAARFVRAQLADLSPGDPLFPSDPPNAPRQRQARLLQILREVDPSLNLRAMRRGSLQALAAVEPDLSKIRQFSGHTNDETLKRYLDWGKMARMRNEEAQHLAAALTADFASPPPSRAPPRPHAGQGSSTRQV